MRLMVQILWIGLTLMPLTNLPAFLPFTFCLSSFSFKTGFGVDTELAKAVKA